MQPLKPLLRDLSEDNIRFSCHDYQLSLKIDAAKIASSKIRRNIYKLLNEYRDLLFIAIEGIPYCYLPGAKEHIFYAKQAGKKYYNPDKCRSCLYFKNCPGLEKNSRIKEAIPIKDLPQEIAFELTQDCNQSCRLCSLHSTEKCSLPFKKIKEVLREGWSLGIKRASFTGGEPTLHKDIREILRYAKDKGFYVRLNTNAISLNEDSIKKIEDSVDNILISLQGCNIKTEEALTGSGRFLEKKLKNIAYIKKSRIPILRIGTMISKTLIADFINYCKIIKGLNIKRWELYRPITARENHAEYKLTKYDFNKVANLILWVRKKGVFAIFGNTLPFCMSQVTFRHPEIFAGNMYEDGHMRLVLDAKDFFKPSYFINKDLGSSILGAWKNPALNKMRSLSYLPEECERCRYLNWCKGGSRSSSWKKNKNLFATDPLYNA